MHPRRAQEGAFRARGSLTYTGPKLVTTKSRRLVSVQIEQSKFSSEELAQLQKLIDDSGSYRIRIQVPPVRPGAPAAAGARHAGRPARFASLLHRRHSRCALCAACWQSDVNDPSSEKVVASIPACLLAASNFHEIVRVHVDQYGHIRGLWYQTMATVCPEGKPSLPAAPVQLVCPRTPLLPFFLPHSPGGLPAGGPLSVWMSCAP